MAKLYFYYSTMNAGKSTALLQAAYNYAERGMNVSLFTFGLDDRDGPRIASRIGIGSDAEVFDGSTDFWDVCSRQACACVLIDEAQFLSKDQVRQLARVVDEADIPVLCYGLRTDFRGELFPGSAALLAWADSLPELKTICCCGRKATMVVRVNAHGDVEREGRQVEIGGNERYVPLCRKHFSESIRTGPLHRLEVIVQLRFATKLRSHFAGWSRAVSVPRRHRRRPRSAGRQGTRAEVARP